MSPATPCGGAVVWGVMCVNPLIDAGFVILDTAALYHRTLRRYPAVTRPVGMSPGMTDGRVLSAGCGLSSG